MTPGELREQDDKLRELDCEIHQEVMGREVKKTVASGGEGSKQPWSVTRLADAETNNKLPRYTLNMTDAWHVVEEMTDLASDGFHLFGCDTKWTAAFRLVGHGKPPYLDAEGRSPVCESAALAICRAALACVRSKDTPTEAAP